MRTETVTVFGAGRSGVAAANLLARKGARVRITDSAPAEKLSEIERLDPSAERYLGSHPDSLLRETDYIVLSPGIPADIEILERARDRGIPVISEIELASRHLRGRIVAVTGSNGKTTTTALIGHLLEVAGKDPVVAGNIGQPLSAVLDLGDERIYVVELSSFQLETTETFHADIALLLNVTPDHMDRYDSFDEYVAAKYRIFRGQREEDLAILNEEDHVTLEADTPARRWTFSTRRETRPGAWFDGKDLCLEVDGELQRIPRARLALEGEANVENALAAWLAVTALGVPVDVVEQGFATFEGLPHRMQLVRELDGVRWINDSKGTNPEATIKSLRGMNDNSVILILGGRDKGSDFGSLGQLAALKARLVIALGEAGPSIGERLGEEGVEIEVVDDLRRAMEIAEVKAKEGDSVLLSPACASYDQYENYEERGADFIRLAERLGGRE